SVVRKIRAPVLFIHGGSDTAVPVSNSEELYRTALGGKKLWVVPGAEHVGSYKKRPQEYISRILELFKQVK
ncbi:MAG: alpha/beta hydrolase, partial [Eubacteriales bacterium]